MRLLYDHQIFAAQRFGGINRYFEELMKLGNEGIAVDRINPHLFNEISTAPKNNLFWRGVRYTKRRVGLITEERQKIKLPDEVKQTITQGDFDLLHPTYYDPYFLELTSKPFVLTVFDMIHEVYKEFFSLSDVTTRNKQLLCKKADQIITISHKTKEDLLGIFNLPEEKVHAIPLASDFDKVIPIKPQGAEGLGRYILYVGTRWIYKNFYYPIIALAEVLKSDSELQVLCTGHPFTAEELGFFKELGIANQVKHIYLKGDNELAWAYRNAALFIFPSLYEGFGLPLLEAFASGCPVISSNGGSLKEVGGNAALYFNPKDVREIQETAIRILYNDAERKQLVEKGAQQFKKFSWDRCRQETVSVYKMIAS